MVMCRWGTAGTAKYQAPRAAAVWPLESTAALAAARRLPSTAPSPFSALWALCHNLSHFARARSSGTADSGSTIWLHSSSTTTSKCWPSSADSREEQQVTPTTGTVFNRRRRCLSAPAGRGPPGGGESRARPSAGRDIKPAQQGELRMDGSPQKNMRCASSSKASRRPPNLPEKSHTAHKPPALSPRSAAASSA